jgi:hypothetical protein
MPKQDFEPGANPALSKTKPKKQVKKVDSAADRLEQARMKELKRPKKLWEVEPKLYDKLLTTEQDKKAEEGLKARLLQLELRDLQELYGALPSSDSVEEAPKSARLYSMDAAGNMVVDVGGLDQVAALSKYNLAKAQMMADERQQSAREAQQAKLARDQDVVLREQKLAKDLAARNAALAAQGARNGAAEALEEIRQRFEGQADQARSEMERKKRESDERVKKSYEASRGRSYFESLFFGDKS